MKTLFTVVIAVALAGSARAEDGDVLIFHGPDRFKGEAERLKNVNYKGDGDLFEALPAADILNEISRRGRDGRKIRAVEILGHGLAIGPYTTSAAGIKDAEDRLTEKKIRGWMEALSKDGVDPKTFFAPGATFTIRACYVGQGKLPKLLLEVLPEDGKVMSDYEYYLNCAASKLVGGMWSRQRVTTRKDDFIYKKGNSGESVPWERRKEGQKGSLVGSWEGTAEVKSVDIRDGSSPETKEKSSHTIPKGALVISELEGGDLELNYRGNLLRGTPDGSHCVFEPVPEKGGAMKAADLTVKENVIEGTLIAENSQMYVVRTLTLTRVK